MRTTKTFLNKKEIIEILGAAGVDDVDVKIDEMEADINRKIRSLIKKAQRSQDDIYDEADSFLEVYPEYNLCTLPAWVLDNISEAKIIGNSKQTVLLKDGRRYQLNNTLNHLSGGEWTFFTNSVLNTAYKTTGSDSFAHKIRKIHPTPKPPQLMRDIIEFFTKEKEVVFDYFMGVGGTLLGASACNREAIGFDLNPKYIEAYKAAADLIGYDYQQTVMGDSLELLNDENLMKMLLKGKDISLVLIDPPYGNMMSREKTGADIKVYGNVATPFTESEKDFGNMELALFFEKLKESVESILPYVKKRGHIVIFIKDLQPSGKEDNLLHAEIVRTLNTIDNIHYKGLKIWADQTAKLFPYGYPFSFVANQIHQYILIFRKEK